LKEYNGNRMKESYKTKLKTLDKVLLLKEKGLSLRDIGEIVKLSPQGVANLIKKYGNKIKVEEK